MTSMPAPSAYRSFGRSRRRRHLSLTVYGLLFTLLLGGVGYASITSGVNLVYMLFAFIGAVLVASAIASWNNLRRIDAQRAAPSEVGAGEPMRIHLRISNRKRWFNTYAVRGEDTLDGKVVGRVFAMHVPAHGWKDANYSLRLFRRGVREWGRLDLSTRFPFGFAEKGVSWNEPGRLIVYPPVFSVESLIMRHAEAFGDFESHRKGQGASLYALREYLPDDSARMIHWRATAKTGELIVREMEAEDEWRFSLILDNSNASDDKATAERFERAVSCMASTAQRLLDDGAEVEALTRSGRIPFDRGSGHVRRILRSLALIQLREDTTPIPSAPPDARRLQFLYRPDEKPLTPDTIGIPVMEWKEYIPAEELEARS